MKNERDYSKDLAEIRSMMERSSKFLSLAGWGGIMAGFYALLGVYIAYDYLKYPLISKGHEIPQYSSGLISGLFILGITIFSLALITAAFLSYSQASKRKVPVWNPSSRRLLQHLFVPMLSGGVLILIMTLKNSVELVVPISLLFYGLGLFAASSFTYSEVKTLAIIQVALGLFGFYAPNAGLLLWGLGFGVAHIVYGIYLHYKYEK